MVCFFFFLFKKKKKKKTTPPSFAPPAALSCYPSSLRPLFAYWLDWLDWLAVSSRPSSQRYVAIRAFPYALSPHFQFNVSPNP
jgi:hypothetical protein